MNKLITILLFSLSSLSVLACPDGLAEYPYHMKMNKLRAVKSPIYLSLKNSVTMYEFQDVYPLYSYLNFDGEFDRIFLKSTSGPVAYVQNFIADKSRLVTYVNSDSNYVETEFMILTWSFKDDKNLTYENFKHYTHDAIEICFEYQSPVDHL